MHGEDCAAIARSRHTRPRPRTNALDNVEVHPTPQPAAPKRTDEPSIHDVKCAALARGKAGNRNAETRTFLDGLRQTEFLQTSH